MVGKNESATERETAEAQGPQRSSNGGRGGITRRSLIVGTAGAAVLIAMGGMKALPAEAQVRPPGGQDEDRLLASCIRCDKCYEICPRGVIMPAHMEDGLIGARTPRMDFERDYCNFCAQENGGFPLCAQVCPTDALNLGQGARAEDTPIGTADLDQGLCLAYQVIGCHFCVDACPVEGALVLDEWNRPVVEASLCDGCGACESACVSLQQGSISAGATRRAIIVKPLEG